jgi:hypothetical protein
MNYFCNNTDKNVINMVDTANGGAGQAPIEPPHLSVGIIFSVPP